MLILKGERILIQSCRKIPASVQETDFSKRQPVFNRGRHLRLSLHRGKSPDRDY
jgi:hypothetical protein